MLSSEELDTQDRSKYIKIVVAAILAGVFVFLAQDILEWVLEVDFDNPDPSQIDVPKAIVDIFGRMIGFARYVGGAIIVLGIIIAVIKLSLGSIPAGKTPQK
ncbi:MAG: hypothetical protein WAO91_01660 [Candidatus Nitrosotenuis sp.]|jgi:hypothetical protein|uniref:Uncharacterized protein n=1 Tax=Candidatus Nitrosotenuis uzonensis TaxID=1407055 RepID=A0A812F1V6_9ARCH|nr:hypothetical protein [Candidatus Nitrosotenuis uzonensis]CAE6485769.1 conserved hypothetical protein [Candidatus Nitrosotenuis uzonensis]